MKISTADVTTFSTIMYNMKILLFVVKVYLDPRFLAETIITVLLKENKSSEIKRNKKRKAANTVQCLGEDSTSFKYNNSMPEGIHQGGE
jgi:hypothetical protein